MSVRNGSKYIAECIRSIQDQSYDNWELCVCDDASTDDTLSLLNEHAADDKRISVFENQSPDLIRALELAYSQSTGTFVTRMDADDLMPPKKLELLHFELSTQVNAAIATAKVRYFSDDGLLGAGYLKYERWINSLMDNNDHYEHIYQECVIPSPCWMMRRSDFDKCGAFSAQFYPEDYDLVFRCYRQQFNIVSSSEILHLWRDHSSRYSRNADHYQENDFLHLKWYYFRLLDFDEKRPLVVWGAGKKGKKLMRIINDPSVNWVCGNSNKVGHNIYGVLVKDESHLQTLCNPQIIVCLSSPLELQALKETLENSGLSINKDYYSFF